MLSGEIEISQQREQTVPDLTALQFLVLSMLLDGERSGPEIRGELKRERRMGVSAFYRLMARLEDAELVKGRYERKTLDDGQVIKERWYRATTRGVRACERTRDFYMARFQHGGLLAASAWQGIPP